MNFLLLTATEGAPAGGGLASTVIMIVVLFFRKGIMGEKELWDLFAPRKKKKEGKKA